MTRQERLRAQGQFRQILDHILDGVVVQDGQTELVYVNPAGARLLGFASAEQALGAGVSGILKDFVALFDETGRPMDRNELPGRQALAGAVEPVRVVRVQPCSAAPGAWKWAWVKASAICDEANGRPKFVVTVFSEITGMKWRELRLKSANQRVVNLLEQVLASGS